MRVFLIAALAFILFSCSSEEEKRTNHSTLDDDGNVVMSAQSIEIMDDLLDEFKKCRKNSTKNLLDCKYMIAKALCVFYEIDDFKKKGDYVDYHEMHDIILGKYGTWKRIGDATDQGALEKAQQYANNGQATVAVSANDKYGHVVIIIPGELTKAPSWNGLNVPNCASFFMIYQLEPFVGKSLAYAWSSPNKIQLYTREI